MNREDIIKLAREAGFTEGDISLFPDLIAHFAALVAKHEREACCSGEVLNAANINGGDHPHQVIEKYQAAIRARGNT